METGFDADAPLDYANIQVFPTQNRYEAFVCSNNRVEKLTVGPLEQLLPHIPGLKALQAEGSVASFKLQLPGHVNGAAWFSESTLNRFLEIVNSPDLVNITKVIEGEMSQLEEARKFHLSLYSQGHRDQFEAEETDGHNSNGMAPVVKPDVPVASSDSSKNELLRAMDLRISALRGELAAAFSQAAVTTLSDEEVADLSKFVQNFGAEDLNNSLSKVLELRLKSHSDDLPADDETSFQCVSRNDSESKSNGTSQPVKLPHPEMPVKYSVSPAKVTQVERQNSTESGESSDSSDENQTSVERSRAFMRSATPRRSASPMRRVQIGRAGSRRAAALTVKSLNYFPARERTLSQRDVAGDSSEEEGSEQTSKKTENHIRRMSVQDAINLFERKQMDQTTGSQTRNSLANISVSGNKSILRRWSAGMEDSSAHSQPHIDSEDSIPVACNDEGDVEFSNGLIEAKSEADLVPGGQSTVETTEVDVQLERWEEKTTKVQANTDITQREQINERLTASAEWTGKKEVELNQMLKKMESQPTNKTKPSTSKNQKLSSKQRGGFYDHYKEKRDERKAEMASKNVNDVSKKPMLKKPQKSAKNLPQSTNPKKETPKPSAAKKVSSKTSSVPVPRKSWPSTPSSRTAGISPARAHVGITPARAPGGISPAKTPGGISSAGATPTRRKPQSAPSHPQPTPKVEGLRKIARDVKETETNNYRSFKGMNEKKQQTVAKSGKATKAKVASASVDSSGMVPAKPSFYNKMTKKSSVVPLESKPFLRKGSGTGPGVGTVNKTKISAPVEEASRNSENFVEAQESEAVNASVIVMEHQEQDIVSLDHCDSPLELETTVSSQQICSEVENFDEPAADNDDGLKNMTESHLQIPVEEESSISPSAWVEIEEHHHDTRTPNPHHESTSQLVNPANIVPIGLSSPRIRHSLSQMLQEESSEPESTEWGTAENPPALVYQKDAPKGLKRLLKFARKSKTDGNSSGWSGPVFSEGESDAEESKASNKKNADNLLRKAVLNAKVNGMQKTSSEDCEKNVDAHILSVQSDISGFGAHNSQRLHKNHVSAAAPTTKASRAFFSFSAFRGSKPNDMKL